MNLTLFNTISFGIFHKSTHSVHVIHSSSNHCKTHKPAGFHNYIHSVVNSPQSNGECNEKLNIIKQSVVYPKKNVNKNTVYKQYTSII